MDTSKEIIYTREGYQKLLDDIARCERKREQIRNELAEARAFGDLSENAEYEAAREEQGRNETLLNDLYNRRANAKIVEVAEGEGDEILIVGVGTTVELEDPKGKKTSFSLVGTTETNSLEHKISNESPAGEALIGAQVGDVVEFATPAGATKTYTVVKITRSTNG